MSFDKSLWSASFDEKDVPLLPCPKCLHGRLTLASDDLRKARPGYNEGIEQADDFEPDWKVERFIALFRCNNRKCGEVVVVSGDVVVEEYADESTPPHLRDELRPRSVSPPPPIIRL